MITEIVKFFTDLRKNDPVYSCDLHKEIGCSHVDGMLCDFPTCSMLEDYEVDKIMVMSDNEVLENITNDELKGIEEMQARIRETLRNHRASKGGGLDESSRTRV